MATDAEKAQWYDEIAPRLTNFANDLPDGVVARGVDVLNQLREFKRANASEQTAILSINVDDLACFLMCVDQFWEQHNTADIAKRLAHSAGEH